MKKYNISKLLIPTFLIAFLVLMGWLNNNISSYTVRILGFWAIYIIFSSTLQLVYGYSGQLTLGHAGLIAIGAYIVAILTISPENKQIMFLLKPPIWPISIIQWPFLPSILITGIITAGIGFLVSAPALRLRGDYLSMVTLGFSEVIRLIIVNCPSVFNGAMGLRSIPPYANLAWTWGLAIITVFVIKRLESSSYGRAMKAICEDEIASEALGINLYKHKILAFVVSAFFAGIGGGLMASVIGTIDPNTFKMGLTNAIIMVVILGGIRSVTGVILASGIYVGMSELFRVVEVPRQVFNFYYPGIPGMRVEVFAFLLLIIILYLRNGILGSREFSFSWFSSALKYVRNKNAKRIE